MHMLSLHLLRKCQNAGTFDQILIKKLEKLLFILLS